MKSDDLNSNKEYGENFLENQADSIINKKEENIFKQQSNKNFIVEKIFIGLLSILLLIIFGFFSVIFKIGMNKDISLIYSLSNLYMFLTIFLSLSIVNIIYICYQSYSKNKNMNDFNTPGNIIALVSLALLMISDILSYKIFFFINIMNKIPRSLQTNRNELNIIYEFIGDINVLTKKFTISIFIYIIVIILLIVSIIMLSLELNKKIKNYKAKKL